MVGTSPPPPLKGQILLSVPHVGHGSYPAITGHTVGKSLQYFPPFPTVKVLPQLLEWSKGESSDYAVLLGARPMDDTVCFFGKNLGWPQTD